MLYELKASAWLWLLGRRRVLAEWSQSWFILLASEPPPRALWPWAGGGRPRPPLLLLEAATGGCQRLDLGTKVQGVPRWLWEGGSACPSPGTALQGVVGRGLGSKESGPWPQGLRLGEISWKGKNIAGTLPAISGRWARQASGLRDGRRETEGPGRQEEAWGGGRARRRAPPGPSESGGVVGGGAPHPGSARWSSARLAPRSSGWR